MRLAAGTAGGTALPAGPLARQPSDRTKAPLAAADVVPEGGMFWDGRADTLEEQVLGPLLSPFEMANRDRARRSTGRCVGPMATISPGCSAPGPRRPRHAPVGGGLRAGPLPGGRPGVPRLHQQVRRLSSRQGPAFARRGARTEALRRSEEGKLRLLPPRQGDRRRAASPSSPTTSTRRSACHAIRRSRPMRDPKYFDLGICGPERHDVYARQHAELRPVQDADLAQRRDATRLLPQRRLHAA